MNNPNIKIQKTELLSDNWYILNKVTFDYQNKDNTWGTQKREVYDRGNGAVILLYNTKKKTVILTKQFRLPTYLNGNETGLMIEACAGLLDEDHPEQCIIREKVFESYMSPGAVTEILYFFTGEYDESMKVSEGGGLDHEQENIEVLEFNFEEAYAMIASGEIKDAKTIMLLQYVKINNLV